MCAAICCKEQWLTKSLQTDPPAMEATLSCSRNNSSDCPWDVCFNGSCKCSAIYGDPLECTVNGNIAILDCYCVTYSEGKVELGMCIFNCLNRAFHKHAVYSKLSNNASALKICNTFNRQGTLCGLCAKDTFPLVYSFNLTCVSCPTTTTTINWIKYISIAVIPLTCFYFVVFIFKVNIVSSHLHGFVMYGQAVTMPVMSRIIVLAYRDQPGYMVKLARVISALYGIWNLDFARSFDLGICLRTSPLLTLSLDFIVALYPFLLMLLSYLLITLYDQRYKLLVITWRPFKHILGHFSDNWDVKTSLIDSFATFFILSHVKFLSVAYDLLLPVEVYNLSPPGSAITSSRRLFYDATIIYFGKVHHPYAILAIVNVTVFVILPALILLLYSLRLFQKILNTLPGRWYVLHTFVDSLQGCFKDGTEPGTRDCRWFVSLFILGRCFLFIVSIFAVNSMFFGFASILITTFSIILLLVQPYKQKFQQVSHVTAIFLLFLALVYATAAGRVIASVRSHRIMHFFTALVFILWFLPLLYVSILTFKWIMSHRKFGLELFRRWQAKRRGYKQILN